jgi:hypothetical protein
MEGVFMIDISGWTEVFLERLHGLFPGRVFFVGLQGSYSRGEASDDSDIDMVVILNTLDQDDLAAYRRMLDSLEHRDLICGFLSGMDELMNWEPFDLFTLYYDTVPLFGSLGVLARRLDREAVQRAVRVGACNIYHGCVHNYLHGENCSALTGLYKCAVFVVQARIFLETGNYIARSAELMKFLPESDREIVDTYRAMKMGETVDLDVLSGVLFRWVQNILIEG